ncbi:ribokinase [Micromonospora sp. DR5-3]|uniref:ribokinase n=1 Tax=unclassified Micromonospora TaxID=2617518 RepID=UPI0011DBD90B|nr:MULTISPECIES: ribokinase [unclassified Micromonospora]MCW3819046.1 ribokinase [Micromonospora sp. DR5-3]TYC17202.1 ribokinase [Micromonospora sp. MP36]
MTSGRIVVVGSLNMDLSIRVPRLPSPGETVAGTELVRGAGGKGANQALAARRLGAHVALVGMVGADQFGAELRDSLSGDGVDVSGVMVTADAATGVALIVVGPDGENMITISPGANAKLATPKLHALLDGAQALLLQLEIPIDACRAAADAARSSGVPVVLNAAPLPQHPSPDLAELIRRSDVLVVNETEAAGLAPDATNATSAASALRNLGVAEVVVTLGGNGAIAASPTGITHVPAFPVDAVDTVGAGDAFCAEFALARTASGTDLRTATRRACAAGALAASRRGAQAALPYRDEVDRLFDAPTHDDPEVTKHAI